MDFWPSCGYATLQRDTRGWLLPTPAFFKTLLARPELALVAESCAAEIRLHERLLAAPLAVVSQSDLQQLADPDAAFNYSVFLKFRDALLASGTLEQYYQSLFAAGSISIPPDFLDLLTQLILCNLLSDCPDAQVLRAADLAFVQSHQQTGGLGELGRLLVQNKTALRAAQLRVLNADNAADYWPHSERHDFALDLTHEFARELSHGLVLRMTHARSGLKALAEVLRLWIAHFFGVQVAIRPESAVEDPNWRWHIGLDPDASALLNDLYQGQAVLPERMQRLISLFRLEFSDATVVQPDVRGKPVYLGLCMRTDGSLKLKPQNLLLNLPLAA
jgi:hypothetical protein